MAFSVLSTPEDKWNAAQPSQSSPDNNNPFVLFLYSTLNRPLELHAYNMGLYRLFQLIPSIRTLWETSAWTVNRDNITITLTGGVHVSSLFLQMLDVDFLDFAAFRFFRSL